MKPTIVGKGEREEGGREREEGGRERYSIEMNKAQRVYGIIMSSTWSLSIEMLKSESPKYSTEPEKTKNYNQNIFTRNELRESVCKCSCIHYFLLSLLSFPFKDTIR